MVLLFVLLMELDSTGDLLHELEEFGAMTDLRWAVAPVSIKSSADKLFWGNSFLSIVISFFFFFGRASNFLFAPG